MQGHLNEGADASFAPFWQPGVGIRAELLCLIHHSLAWPSGSGDHLYLSTYDRQ